MSAAVAAAAAVGSSIKCSSSNSSNASFNLMSSTSLSHINSNRNFSPFFHPHHLHHHQPYGQAAGQQPSRYESQKRRDWATFGQYLKNHKPPLSLPRCSGAHVLEFLRYLDQFGKTKVHADGCPFFGHPHPPAPCPCPLKQAWGSLDALVGRLRAAFEENGGQPEMNPFGARAVRLYLRDVRDGQAKARGIAYEKKKRKKPQQQQDHHHPEKQRADKNHNNMVMKSNYGGNNINDGNESGLGAMEVSEPRVGCMGIALSVMNF